MDCRLNSRLLVVCVPSKPITISLDRFARNALSATRYALARVYGAILQSNFPLVFVKDSIAGKMLCRVREAIGEKKSAFDDLNFPNLEVY